MDIFLQWGELGMSKKKLLLISLIVIVALAIPLTIYIVQQQQESRSRAVASTTLAFTPSPQTKNVDDEFTLTININPGTNIVSFVSLDIQYDATKFEVSGNRFQNNASALPIVLQGPIYTEGRIRVNISSGNDPTRAISSPTNLGTVTFRAIAGTGGSPSEIKFGDATNISSIAGPSSGSNDSFAENVLSSSTPALITVSGGAAQPSPSAEPSISPQPSPSLTISPSTSPVPSTSPSVSPSQPAPSPSTPASPSPSQQATNTSTSPSPTILAQAPTNSPTPISGNVNSNSAFTTGTPTPTIAATGPGFTYIAFGAIVSLFILVGSILFFTL